jgi:trimeric autotransporter adhesin
MKTKILSGLICCLGIFSANAQTITAPVGQSLTVTNPIDITVAGGSVNVPTDGTYKIGGFNILKTIPANLFVGKNSGTSLSSGIFNTFVGENSGALTSTGNNNLFAGYNAGSSNTSGSSNMFFGSNAGFSNISGLSNSFIGTNAGYSNTTGGDNLFIGSESGRLNVGGIANTFIGNVSGYSNTSGTQNLFLGTLAGNNNISGSNNVCIGFNAMASGANAGSLTNTIIIGANATATTSNTIVLGNAATTVTGTGLGAGLSGLRFANLTSASGTTAVGGNKVLSVDGTGNVVLVALTSGTVNSVGGPVAEKTWKDQDGYLYNNSTNGVVINGTGLDGNSLIVKGGVLSKEVNVKVEGSESWPDYVFKPSYKRMTLDEVEKFININGHLPNVASATEMAVTGNNLNKTDIKLFEKVEELTLYLLEMKKANEAQNAEIQNLKKQVKSLRRK